MMSAGPSGFANAPVSKGLVIACAGASLLASFLGPARASLTLDTDALHHVWRLLTHNFIFNGPGEMLFGLSLLYSFRLFERQWGGVKFGNFVFQTLVLSTATSLAFMISLGYPRLRTGPFGLMFACLVNYALDIPSTLSYRVLGLRLTDKSLTYILSLQLLFSSPPDTVLSALSGVLAGLATRGGPFTRVRLPRVVVSLFRKTLLPFLYSAPARPRGGVGGGGGGGGGGAGAVGMGGAAWGGQGPRERLVGGAGGGLAAMAPVTPDEGAVELLMGMGFPRERAVQALTQTRNNVELATNMLLDGSM